MADSENAAGLTDVHEKEDESDLDAGAVSEAAGTSQEVDELKEQLKVHIETIGFLLTEKTELESALAESEKTAEMKQATVEELQKRLDSFSRCASDTDACAVPSTEQRLETCQQLKSEKDSQTTRDDEIIRQLRSRLETQETAFVDLKSRFDLATEENERLKAQSRRQSERLIILEDERESSRREYARLVEQQAKGREDASNVLKIENETLQREHVQQVEELVGKMKLLAESLDVLRNEKESLLRENAQTMEQLQQKEKLVEECAHQMEELELRVRQREEAVKELLGERNRLSGENARLVEQLQQRDLSVGKDERQIEQLQDLRKQLEAQVSSLLNEKDQLLGRCDEQQSLLEDLRLRYAVASEELSQSNEATQMVTDAFNKLKVQLDQVNHIAGVHATENQELSRKLEEKADSVRKLEGTIERSNSTKTEHGKHLENRKTMLNGNSDGHGNPSIDDAFERYSNDVLENLRQNAPLIERLQKELNSAQDTINALTNQNSELKSRTKSVSNGNAETLQSLSRLEMERNRLKEELEELRRQHRSLEEKMELAEEDLARQVPATFNDDVVNRVQFEALQSVMKRVEAKYTQVMRDKAELMDTTERLEHIIMQLQDESNTIGEYVSLYHHQRFVLRQRTAEKDGYIYQLANERTALQSRLAQLQTLIMQLLNERCVFDASNHTSGQEMALAGDASPVMRGDDVGWRVEVNGEGRDESNSGEEIPNASHSVESGCSSCQHGSEFQLPGQPSSLAQQPMNIPDDKQTAQKIMHLLQEIGTSQLVDGRPFEDRDFVRCGHCSGKVLVA